MSISYYISISSYLGDSAALQSSVIEAIDDKQDVYPQGKQKKTALNKTEVLTWITLDWKMQRIARWDMQLEIQVQVTFKFLLFLNIAILLNKNLLR